MTVEDPIAGRKYVLTCDVDCEHQGMRHPYRPYMENAVVEATGVTTRDRHPDHGIIVFDSLSGHHWYVAAYEMNEIPKPYQTGYNG